MELKIAGCRGSLPAPSGKTLDGKFFESEEFGGNTTCFYIEAENGRKIIIDAGTGIRPLGLYLMGRGFAPEQNGVIDLLITHTHWDHIQGFPFFIPAYIGTNKIDIYGQAKVTTDLADTVKKHGAGVRQINGEGIKNVLDHQQNPRNFPAPLTFMKGLNKFYDFEPGSILFDVNGLEVETKEVNHPGGCVSYKFRENGKTLVICTDFEPDHGEKDSALIEWLAGADFVITDGQYETDSKINPFMKGYGHSDPFINLKYAEESGVKNLGIIHHDPKSDDAYLRDFEKRVQEKSKSVQVTFVREGDSYRI